MSTLVRKNITVTPHLFSLKQICFTLLYIIGRQRVSDVEKVLCDILRLMLKWIHVGVASKKRLISV